MITYKLFRKNDCKEWLFEKFFSVTIHTGKDNEVNNFPPRVGDSIYCYNGSVFNSWQTTEVKLVEKINGNKYIFKTKNSVYEVEKILNTHMKLYIDKIKGIKSNK